MTIDKDSTYIWSREQMRAFLKHSSQEVQQWSAEHILIFYPDLLDEMLAFLPQATPAQAPALLDILEEMPLSEKAAPALLEVFRQSEHHFNQARLAVLLARCGYILPDHELDKLSLPYQFAQVEDGFQYLMRRVFNRWPQEKQDGFYFSLSAGLCCEDFYKLLLEKNSNKDQILELIGLQYRQPLLKMLKVKDSASALRVLTNALAGYRAFLSPASGGFTVLTEQLDRAYEHCLCLSESVRKYLERGGRIHPKLEQVMLAGAIGLIRDTACRKILSQDNPSAVDFLTAVIMRKWTFSNLDPATLEWLRGQDAKRLFAGLESALCNEGWNYAESAFNCLDSAGIQGRHQFLLKTFKENWPINVQHDAIQALRQSGPKAVTAALEYWKDNPPFAGDLIWLEGYPTREVVRYLLDHFEYFIQSDEANLFCKTLSRIGSADFFEPLMKEWRPGEPYFGANILLIAELNGIQDERLKSIYSEVKDRHERDYVANDGGKTGEQPVLDTSVPLRCTACGRTYTYKVERLYLDDSAPEVIIGDIIQCKGCGGIETCVKTSESYLALTSILLSGAVSGRSKGKKEIDSPFKGTLKELEVGGKRIKTVTEAYHFFNEALEKEPQNAEYRRRLGNLLNNGGRLDLAAVQYREALKLNSQDIESTYSLAQLLVNQGKYLEAMNYVQSLGDLIRVLDLENKLKKVFFNALIMLSNLIYNETGQQVRLRPVDQMFQEAGIAKSPPSETVDFDYTDPDELEAAFKLFMSGKFTEDQFIGNPKISRKVLTGETIIKVGRNDPCPCGSGKKYKKCHGMKA